MIDVEDLVFDYESGPVLHGLSFVARTGAVVGVLGPEGAGKSTLLRCIAGLETPSAGRIVAAGVDVARDPRAAHALTGYLPPAFGLYDGLSVGHCLRYAARSRGVPEALASDAAVQAAARVGLEGRMPALAGQLSAPERQRLGLAQALAHRPRVLLLDDSDDAARPLLDALLPELAREGVTVMVSVSDPVRLPKGLTDLLELDEGRMPDGAGLTRLDPHP